MKTKNNLLAVFALLIASCSDANNSKNSNSAYPGFPS